MVTLYGVTFYGCGGGVRVSMRMQEQQTTGLTLTEPSCRTWTAPFCQTWRAPISPLCDDDDMMPKERRREKESVNFSRFRTEQWA